MLNVSRMQKEQCDEYAKIRPIDCGSLHIDSSMGKRNPA